MGTSRAFPEQKELLSNLLHFQLWGKQLSESWEHSRLSISKYTIDLHEKTRTISETVYHVNRHECVVCDKALTR